MANKINIYNSSAIYDSMVKDGFLKADKLSKEKFLNALEYNPKYMPRVRAYAQRVYGMSPEDFDNLVYTTDYTQDVSQLPPSGSPDYAPSMPWDNTPAQFSLPYKTKPGSDNNLPGLPAHDNTSQPNFMRDLSPENVTRRALANAKPQPMQYLPKEEWDKEIRKKEAIQQGLQEIAAHSTRSATDYSSPISVKSVTHPSDLTLGEWYNSFASDTYSIQKEAGRIYQMWQVGAIDEDEARSRFHQLYVSPQTAQSRSFVRTIDERRNFRRNNAAIDAAEAEITKKLQAAAAQKPTQPIPMPYMGDARISDSIDEQYYKQSLRLLDDARKISRAYADNNHNGTSTAKRVLRGIGDNLITPEAITMGFSAIADNANLMRILEKDERGEQLSDAEETLLSAAIIKQYTEAAYASGTGIAYNIGAVTGESLPYMLSFVVTGIPIKAATSGISKRIVNFVGRQLQRKGIGRAATRATKTTLGLGGNIATSALQAPIMPSTYSDYLDRRIGTIDSTTDGMGNISFSHQGDSRSTAALKAYFNTFYQNFGERSGEAISSLWGMFGRGIGKIPIGRGKSINDIFNTIHDSRLGKFWDTMQGTAVADFMRQANYDGVFAEVAEEYISGILNAATIGDQSFEELFSQDNLLTTMGGIALTSVMLGSANATLGVAATQRIRTNFNRSSKAAQQYFSPEQLNQLIGISGGSVQDITTFLAANIARRQLIARQISQLADRRRNGETGIEAQINTLGAELQDLRMQYDFVNASAMYNAYIGGLSRRIEPMREQARAAIRANGDPATGLTIQVDINGRQGYLIGGNYNHIQDADGNISVTPTGDLATVLFDGDKTPTPNIPMETISILGVRRTDDVIRDGDRAIFAATEQEENAAQAPATGSTVTVSGSQGNFILQGYDPQGNAIVTPLNTDGTPAVKNGNPITASVPSENIIPEEADNTSSSIRTGSIAYIDGIPYSVDQVDGENAIIHRLNTDGTPVNDEQGNPVTSIVPTATLSSSPHPAQTVEPQNVPDEQQPTTKQQATEQDAAIEETNTQQQPAIVDDNITETPSSALSRIPIDKNGKPIYEQSDPETAYDAILQQADGDTALASRVILSMIDNKEAALKKLSKTKPRRADNPADIIKAEKELAAQIKQAESDLQFWKDTALVPSLRNQAQKEAEANSVIQDPSLADTPDSRTRDNDGSGNHQGIGAIQADVASTQENSEERLTHEEALAIISDMEKHAEVAPEIELTPENWVKEFGNDGIVNTPIGEVKQGDNQYLKLAQQGRNSKLGMVRPTLERPSIIILDERPAREGKSDRDTSFVFIKTFIKEDGTRYYYFTSVTVSKEGKEVVISSQERSANRISKLLQQGKIAWIDTAFSLHPTTQVEGSVPLNDSNTPTVTDNQPALLGINSSELSQNKDNEKSPISSDLGEKIAAAEAETDTKPSQAQKEDETKHPGTTSSFDDIHPIGHGAFGDIYDQFKGKPQEAIEFLSEKQGGEAIGALHHKDVGDISLVWGNDKAGLKKILAKHPEVTNDIQGILEDMRVIEESDNRIKLDSPTHFAVVSKEIFGTPRDKWLLTAYEKKNSASDNTMDTVGTVTGKQNDTATLQNTVSDNKDSDSPSKKQTDTTNTQTKKKAEDPKEYIPKAEKIEDVGEKIGGARKDIIHELTEKARKADSDKSSILDSIRSMPVSKIFNFDYERLRKDGVSNELITLLQVIREIIPSKPRSEYKLRRWTEQVFELYYASLKLITLHDAEQRAFFDKILGINQIDKIYQARMALGGFDSGLNTGKATLEELGENAGHYDKEGNWVSLKGHWYVKNAGKNGGIFPSRKEAEDALRTFAGENASPENSEKKTQFSVYRRNVDGTAFITVKGKPSIIVADGFKNSKEALDYLKTNYADLDAKYRSMKEKTNIAFRENRPRKGRDWRNGKNISAEEFRETFGFRGVEFGNWTNQEDRQQALNNAFDAFMDLADAIGKSPRSLSLNGQLGIAFGARGGGRAAAHYEPDKVVINLTKTQGAGSLAHEWWHAIDNYFARRRGQQHVYNSDRTGYKYNTEKKGAYSENERQELTDAFKELMNAIDNSSYGKRSRAYASMKSSYWSRPTELGARAFAIWIERKLSERGTVNDFLANNPTSTDWGNPDMVTKYYPYPIEGDFDTLDTAFDNLFNAIQEEVDATTGNTILFHHGDVIGSMTAEQRAAFDAVMSMLKEAGVPVEVLSYEQMRQLADMNGAATRKGTKKTPETDSAPLAEKYQHTAISSADGSKVLKNLETLAENYENSLQTKEKTFIGEVADALNIERTGASSRYATFETKNGQIVTIRLSNHNATVSNFDNASEQEGISIVVSPKKNTGINNDGNAHVVEFYYDAIKLRKADGKPLAQIVRSIQQALYSGEYRDTTGLAVQEEVNDLRARLMTVYHGSGATFEQFDHSHIGEGEGVQAYGWGSYVTEVEDIGRAYAEDLGNKVGSSRNLYTVEIPDDTGNNYLWWEKTLRQKVLRDIARKLEADYGDAIWVPEHLRNMPLESKMRYWMKETYPGNEKTGEAFYNCLSVILGSDRAASEFLSSAGFTGISYPAQYTSGGREDNARNYVIFNEENLKITDHVQFLKDRKGVVYGAAVGGKIYLNASTLNPETPIHEYTHLWDEACRRANPELWQRGVELMKQTQLWNEVKNDPNYVNLLSDDEIASEVHARLTGRDGAKLLERMVNEDKENGVIAAANAVSLRERLKKWLSDFWYWLKDSMTPWSREQASKISLSDFVNIPLTDLIKRTNILFREIPDQSTTQEQTNDRFNNELQQQIDGTLPKGHIYDLGMPSDTLLNAGLPNLPIEMAASRLSDKSMQENHPFDLSEIRNLPKAIQSPMAIFRSATRLGSFVVMTEIEHHGRNFVVAIQANRRKGRIEVNDIRSVHYRTSNSHIANWVTEGLLEYADKKRMVEWLSKQRYNSAEVRKLFNHATNIIQNFDNPKNNNENIRLREMAAEVADAARPAQVTRQIERLAREMNLPIEIIHSIDDIPDEYTRRYIQGEIDGQPHTIVGYYDRTTGKAYIILPAILQTADPLAEAERTILHEVIAHHGMQALMGRDAYDTLCDEVWQSLPYETRARFAAYVLRKNPRDLTITDIARVAASPALRRAAADEYIAALAEGGVENPTLWQRIKAFFRSILRRMHLYSISPTDADIRYLLSQARENLAQTSTESAKAILQESNDIRFKYTNVDGINMSENAKKALEDGKTDVGKELELAYFIKESGLGTWNGEYHHVGKNYNRHYFVKLNDGVTLPAARKAFKKYLEDKRKAEIKAVLDKYPDAMTRQQVIDAGGRVFPAENRTHKDIAYAGGEYWYIPITIQEQTNDRFNDELQQQIDGTLPKGHIYDLGMPSDTLLNAGLPNLPIEMAASRLSDKSMQENHPFDLSEIRNLPKAIQSPMAIFRSATRLGSFVVMTEIEHHGRNFVVAIQANRRKGRIEVNDIRSVHYRTSNSHIANWVTEGLLEYADKKRMVEWLSKQRYNSAEVRKLFNHATNIIQNFDNPKNNNENIRLREMAAEVADAARPAQVTRQIERLAREMNLPIEIIHSIDDIPDEYTRRYIQGEIDGQPHTIVGYYDRTTGKAYIILPAILQTADPLAEAERTILHEVIAHHGMQALMGRDAYDTLCDEVWQSLPYETRARFAAYVLRKNPRDLTITDIARVAASPALRRAAADEYIAALAEGGVENPTLWQRIKAFFRSILRRMHLYSISPTDADIRYLLSQARENLAQTSTESIHRGTDIRFRELSAPEKTSHEDVKNRIEDLFNKAVSGDLKGKPVSIGTLTKEGKYYLEKLSGITFKDRVDFVLNPSDLVHIYKRHYGGNEKDGRNIPLDINDIRSIADIISNPNKVIFSVEEGAQERKMFSFLKEAEEGSYNLLEIYSDRKGNLTAKSFYKSKEGVSQRAISLTRTLHSTSGTDGATLNTDAKIPQMFETSDMENKNLHQPDTDIRLRELSVPEETIDNASRQGNDYARDARTHAAASIDTHNPDLSPVEQAEAVRFRELLTRDFSAASDFLNSANLINAAMQANDGKAAWLNNIQEAVFDSMLRLRLLLDRMKKEGASIPAGFNPYLAENQSRSRAQNRIAAFNEDYRRPLIESLAKCINKLREENIGVAIKDNNAAHEALSLYAQARAAVERQEVKEREAREQAKADGTEYKHREWAGLPGIQYAIIALYKGEITDDVEANKNNLLWLQDFATENNIPTVEQYITMVEDALQKENIDNLWENIRRISEFQLTTSRDAGILSRGSYQLLTYGYNIDNIIETLYIEQRKKITDDINNGIGDKDSLAADLADLDRRHLEAVATATDLDAPDAITTLVAGGWITQDIANDIHRYYNYYLPLKGHAEITGEDLFDYNTPSMPRNASRIKSVRGHEQLARDPFNQILRDAEGCIVQAERNRWKQQLYHVLSTNRSLANGQYAIQRKYYQVIKLDDGTVRYEPYQRVVTTENNEDITTFVPTSEEIAAGTAVLLNSSAKFDIYVSQKQRSEHETIVYIDGSPISILFYDARIAKAVNGTNEAYPPQWMPRAIIQASRTIPALLTSWHPEFVLLSNPIRDTQEAIANAAIDKGFKYTALLARNLATVDRDLWAYTGGKLKQKKDNGQPLSQYEKYVTEFFENGGSVNVTQLSDYETTTKDLKKELKRALKGGTKPSKNFWKRLTEQTELRSRIATYITSRQTGSTIQDAINDAKEITVNFDRRGAQFRNFNLLQMFFNAQMQSVRRQTELMRRHPVRYATTVAILASSKVLIGLGISLLLGGGDDDNTTAEDIIRRYFEINKQLRTRNHIFIIDGEVYRIPVAPAFIPFTTLCEEAAQLAFDPSSRHRNTASQALLSVTSSVLETYVPTLISDPANIMMNVNNEQAWRQSFASGIPMSGRALWQPFIEAIYNYDYTGNPIYTEPQFGAQHLPFHRDYRERTGKAYVYTSKLLSDLTGGNNVIPGKINIHPEQIEHVVQGLAGGIGTLAGRFTGIYKRVQGESAESAGLEFLYDIPFAARLYGGNMQQRENRYYQSLFFDDKQALEAFRAQKQYIESSQDMQDFNKEYNRETRKYFYDFATADKLATKVRKWRDAHQKGSPEYKQYEAILQDIYRTTDDAFNRLQQSNDNEPYEIIDNPYYIYNNIESQLDKELYNVNGTFMTIDDAARAWAARTRRDKKQYYTLSGDLRQIAKIRDEVKEIKKLFKEIGSDYYPGMPLNGRQQYIYRRIEQKTKALSSLYDEIALDNIQLIE